MSEELENTPIEVIANVSRVVTKVIDRLTGDRSESPLLVAAVGVEALKGHGIEARLMYGQAAWIEIMENQLAVWAGCWGENLHFWIATQFGEVVDLNTSVAHRKRAHERSHASPEMKPQFSPPILWSREVPAFYRYLPEGIAELELQDERDIHRFELACAEVREKCTPAALAPGPDGPHEPEFPNEAILCPGRKLLDDTVSSFKLFDRALAVQGIPKAPF